jgi:tetratricopeptide (TPR) repeat protein
MAFESPNACNLCHTDQSAEWADQWVREWYPSDYQAPILHRAGLIDAARKQDWTRLPEMLDYVAGEERDEIFANSLLRLLENCPDKSKWPVFVKALKDPSPLIRATAATGLAGYYGEESVRALVGATGDPIRLVRIRAAASLVQHSQARISSQDRDQVAAATEEYEAYLKCGPDQWSSHYNLGNYYVDLGRLHDGLKEFNIASRLQPQVVAPLVNASMVHARLGDQQSAERRLRDALAIEPENAIVNFNLGLLLAERNRIGEAETMLRSALETDPEMAAAAYNLAVLVAARDLSEALQWCRRSVELRPDEPKYSYTLAFFLNQAGDLPESSRILENLLQRFPDYFEAYALLGNVLTRQERLSEARNVYEKALQSDGLPPGARRQFEMTLDALPARGRK